MLNEDKIKIVIVEDEETWVLSLKGLLNSLGFEVVAIAKNLAEAIDVIHAIEFDIALLDIHLDGINSGISLGKLIRNTLQKPFIFITASYDSHHINEAVQANPSAYLTKPTNRNTLYIAIQNAFENFIEKKQIATNQAPLTTESFFIKRGKKYVKIFWKNVFCLKSDQKYTALELVNDTADCFIRSSLQNTIKHIVPESFRNKFIQINRSECVNIDFVIELQGDIVTMENGNKYFVSESHMLALKNELNIMK